MSALSFPYRTATVLASADDFHALPHFLLARACQLSNDASYGGQEGLQVCFPRLCLFFSAEEHVYCCLGFPQVHEGRQHALRATLGRKDERPLRDRTLLEAVRCQATAPFSRGLPAHEVTPKDTGTCQCSVAQRTRRLGLCPMGSRSCSSRMGSPWRVEALGSQCRSARTPSRSRRPAGDGRSWAQFSRDLPGPCALCSSTTWHGTRQVSRSELYLRPSEHSPFLRVKGAACLECFTSPSGTRNVSAESGSSTSASSSAMRASCGSHLVASCGHSSCAMWRVFHHPVTEVDLSLLKKKQKITITTTTTFHQLNSDLHYWLLAASWQVVPLFGVKLGWLACTWFPRSPYLGIVEDSPLFYHLERHMECESGRWAWVGGVEAEEGGRRVRCEGKIRRM